MSALSRKNITTLINAIEKVYPKAYADSTWDNTGLLINSSLGNTNTLTSKITTKCLLTIDLTSEVCDEAIKNKVDIIISYHPFIFPKWNSISSTTQHKSTIKLIQSGISVYSPHTAVDAVKNGMNDYLLSLIFATPNNVKSIMKSNASEDVTEGMGRFSLENNAQNLKTVIESIKKGLNIKFLQIALPDELRSMKLEDINITSAAVCAGSGGSVFSKLKENCDLILTGEMDHHTVLKYKELGTIVVVVNHSNSERAYLRNVMKPLLEKSFAESDQIESCDVLVSEQDHDPLQTV
ncbi:related to NGG1-interacting factor 3 [Hanseniaspora guilliermondii]|uniref:Related to NGG1-interacting factor 3 n=1 Tax=Hanseniaspora guilliermondii TaxID=56406 RepID=A0A1L0CYP0_9ASCO|nr:related to NGG1-interacting factor 3 [Hanseniaspora guilliermondii]